MHVHTPLADGPSKPTGAVCFRQVQAGDRDSLNELMAGHDGLVQAVVRRQALGDLPFAEALQASRVCLWRAIANVILASTRRPARSELTR